MAKKMKRHIKKIKKLPVTQTSWFRPVAILAVVLLTGSAFWISSIMNNSSSDDPRGVANAFAKAFGDCDFKVVDRYYPAFRENEEKYAAYLNDCDKNNYSLTFDRQLGEDDEAALYQYALLKNDKRLGRVLLTLGKDPTTSVWQISTMGSVVLEDTDTANNEFIRNVIHNQSTLPTTTQSNLSISKARLAFPISTTYTLGYFVAGQFDDDPGIIHVSDLQLLDRMIEQGDAEGARSCHQALSIVLDYASNGREYYAANIVQEKQLADGRTYSIVTQNNYKKCAVDQKKFVDYLMQATSVGS